jgi:hypothetical protein
MTMSSRLRLYGEDDRSSFLLNCLTNLCPYWSDLVWTTGLVFVCCIFRMSEQENEQMSAGCSDLHDNILHVTGHLSQA